MNKSSGILLTSLAYHQSRWSQRTFGSDARRGPIGAVKHLRKEADELLDALFKLGKEGTRREVEDEIADCFLLILDASRRFGLGTEDLLRVAIRKHEENVLREWPPITDEGCYDGEPVEHIRSHSKRDD